MNGSRRDVPRTRYELVKAHRRLERVRKGADMLRRKRSTLVAELFREAAPAAGARSRVVEQTRRAVPALLEAFSVRGEAELMAAGRPGRRLEVEVRSEEVWGVPVAALGEAPPVRRSPVARGTGPAVTGPAADRTATEFEALVGLLLDAASRDVLVRRLAAAVSRTSRQMNTLEQRVAPELESATRRAERVLEEREREEHLRIRQVVSRRRGRAAGGRPSARGASRADGERAGAQGSVPAPSRSE